MLDHFRQRVASALAGAARATLSSFGPANLQASVLPCEAAGLRLYLLLPLSSDHLVNLGTNREVVVTTDEWMLQGTATLVDPEEVPPGLALGRCPHARWVQVVEVRPVRLHLRARGNWGFSETIDLD